jgi:hypothetical protein
LTPLTRRTIGFAHTLAVAAPLVLVACTDGPVQVQVRATGEGEAALPGVEITALPYDPTRILDSLAALDSLPRPDFTSLEREVRAFEPPAFAKDDPAVVALAATRDSVRRLADSLRAIGRTAPAYGTAYGRFRALYRRLVDRAAARDASLREVTADVRSLAERAGRAADSLRAWEQDAYGGYDSAAALALAASGRTALTATTGPDGWADFELPRGRWWLLLRLPHPENPFLEYRWRVPVVAAGFPFRVPLSSANWQVEWRH